MSLVSALRADASFHYGRDLRGLSQLKALVNPSLVAALWFRVAAHENPAVHLVGRWVCLVAFSCDVAAGARFLGPLDLPHPVGIVIGRGAVLEGRVRVYQHVTVGSSRKGSYPLVSSGATLYSNSVIAGDVVVGQNSTVGANCTVTKDVPAGSTVTNK